MTAAMPSGNRYAYRLPADQAALDDFLAGLPQHTWYPAAAAAFGEFALKLCLYEALINALRHGNRGVSRPEISVTIALQPAEVVITIDDAGPGFPVAARRAVIAAVPPAESGCGLLLIEHYADRLNFNPAGNLLTITKQQRPAGSTA